MVPDARDLARVDEALAALIPPENPENPANPAAAYVTLTAELGPAERYRRWLTVLRGEVMIVAGTRAAMFAPVRNLGLVVLWDDGDDLHAEPHAPYPNAREVLALRAHRGGAAALIGGFARTTELTQLVTAGWARPLAPDRQTLRATAPRVKPAADDRELGRDEGAMTARLPSLALRTAREALAAGPRPHPGAQARLSRRHRLCPLPYAGPVHPLDRGNGSTVQRPPAANRAAGRPRLPLVRRPGRHSRKHRAKRLALPALRPRQASRDDHGRRPNSRRARPRLSGRQGPHLGRVTWSSRGFRASPPW